MRRLFALLATLFLVQLSFVASAAHAASVQGIVRDPDGRGVPGARVIVTGGGRPGASETVTDREGRFQIERLPEGRHELRVAIDGLTGDPHLIDVSTNSSHEIVVDLRVSAVAESLVVSAAQVDLPLSQAAASLTVISGRDIAARQVRTVGDALRTVPGLAVAQNGTLGGLTSLFTRGGESDFTLVLVDGMRANAFGGGLDLSAVPLVDPERIEIVRGPQSAVFGSDAIGGVVQIVTRRCGGVRARCDRIDAAVEGGSLGSARALFSAAGTRAPLSWSVHAEHAQSDGFTGVAPATGERVSNDDGRVQHGAASIGWSRGGADVRAQTQLSSTERGFPGAFGSNPAGIYTAVDRVSRGETARRQFGLQWTQPWGGASGRVRQRTDVSFSDFDSDFISQFGASESETTRAAVRTQTDAALTAGLGISAGFELLREQAGSTFITGEVFEPIPVKRLVGGYFGEVRYAPAARLSASAGVRVEQIRRDALPANPSAFSPRPAFAEETIVSVNPRVAAAYVLRGGDGARSSTRVRASIGTGIRPPDAFEIAFTDNPGLEPERSRSLDVGLHQTVARGAASVEATFFFNDYDDLIVAVGRSFRDASRYRTDNISNARSRGLELAAGARPFAALDLRASYTLLDAEIRAVDRSGEAPAPYRVGERLIRRPRHRGSVTAMFTGPRATAFAELDMRGTVRDIEPTFGASAGVFDADGFAVLDLGGAYRLTNLIRVFARIENAADRAYEEAFGFPAPGRLFIAGVRIAASR